MAIQNIARQVGPQAPGVAPAAPKASPGQRTGGIELLRQSTATAVAMALPFGGTRTVSFRSPTNTLANIQYSRKTTSKQLGEAFNRFGLTLVLG